jgi:hypothetical protein
MDNPKRARGWKRRIQPRVDLKMVAPVPYSTRNRGDFAELFEGGFEIIDPSTQSTT